MGRTKMIAANWKMNLNLQEGEALVKQIRNGLSRDWTCDVVIAPPFTHISSVVQALSGSDIMTGAQNCHYESQGAFTGEISVEMLKSLGVIHIITGHSERRQLFQETNEIVKEKVNAILKGSLQPIFCCGESLDIRQAGRQNEHVGKQLAESIFHLDSTAIRQVIIAYEPIWAIGTGVTATPEQAQEMHAFIRKELAVRYGDELSKTIRILYGGSIKSDNAATLFSQPDVDGGLVGGASLQAQGFLAIIEAACG